MFAARCFTTIVPRLTNSQNKVALTIMGRGSKGLSSQDAHKENSEHKKNSEGSWGRERRRGIGRYSLSISFSPFS